MNIYSITHQGSLGLFKVDKNGEVNAWKEIPVHKRIVTPLVIGSKHIIFPLLGNQPLVRVHAQILVRGALELKRILGKDSASLHGLHPDERSKPEVEDAT
jgi:hypothetical protein